MYEMKKALGFVSNVMFVVTNDKANVNINLPSLM